MTTATEQRIAEIRAQAVARCPTPESGHDALEIDCADLAFLLSELDAAKKDAERLAWLERDGHSAMHFGDRRYQVHDQTRTGLREAIDAAREVLGNGSSSPSTAGRLP